MTKNTFTTYEIAEYCQVTPRTVVQWINEGKLKAYRTPGNHSRVIIKDFSDFLKKYDMPIPVQLSSERQNNKKRILVVDNDKGIVSSLQRFLMRERAYVLEVAYDGFEAGEKFASFKPDLVILDIEMPGSDGYKVCSGIRKNPQNKNVKILFISRAIEAKDLQEIKKSGGDDYLEKPFSFQDLKTKLHHLFGWNRRSEDRAQDAIPGQKGKHLWETKISI